MTQALGLVRLVFGIALLAVGAVAVYDPYRLARYEEMIDAIGSTRSLADVEPAGWKVTLTRFSGAILLLFGLLWGVLPGYAMLQ